MSNFRHTIQGIVSNFLAMYGGSDYFLFMNLCTKYIFKLLYTNPNNYYIIKVCVSFNSTIMGASIHERLNLPGSVLFYLLTLHCNFFRYLQYICRLDKARLIGSTSVQKYKVKNKIVEG